MFTPGQRVGVTGATGFIGAALCRALESRGIAVVRIGRGRTADVMWDPKRGALDARKLESFDAVVNLAGENIAQRWTKAARREILESRTSATTLLSTALSTLRSPPKALLSGSAIGIYGLRGGEILTESSSPGTGFLADVAQAWENSTQPAMAAGIRVVHLRTGLVLERNGGLLGKMLVPFRLGLGGRLGRGNHWMSWIAMSDYVRAVEFLACSAVSGPVNVVAPNPVTNDVFTKALASALRRPAVFPVPAPVLRTVFGAMATETMLASQRVMPERLTSAGFEFQHPVLQDALRAVLGQRALLH